MKRSFLTILLLSTVVLAACQNQVAPQNPGDSKTQQSTSQVSATVNGAESGSQQNISATQQSQQTRLKVEGVKIEPTDEPIVIDLSKVYDATAHREGSETQAVKP